MGLEREGQVKSIEWQVRRDVMRMVPWSNFVTSLPRAARVTVEREIVRCVEERQADDVFLAVAACRTLEALGFTEWQALRVAGRVIGPLTHLPRALRDPLIACVAARSLFLGSPAVLEVA